MKKIIFTIISILPLFFSWSCLKGKEGVIQKLPSAKKQNMKATSKEPSVSTSCKSK